MEDDYVNISCEDAVAHGGGTGSGDSQRDGDDVASSACAAVAPCGGGGARTSIHSNNNDEEDEMDRKPAARPEPEEVANCAVRGDDGAGVAYGGSPPSSGDQRFVCAICLETVSDQPVVTRCGHLYCWPCLYQWLQPGMFLGEYRVAFGISPPRNLGTDSGSHGGGLNFLSEMTSSYNHREAVSTSNSYNDRPFNPAGARFNEQRRCCPVCKAHCTVDSVIPIYIHVHSSSSAGLPDGSLPSNSSNYIDLLPMNSSNSIDSLNLDDESNFRADGLPSNTSEHSTDSAGPVANATPPRGSPAATVATDNLSSDDPPNANLGLRQRRRGDGGVSSNSFVCDTPQRNHRGLLEGFDSMSNSQNNHDTPVHRNSRGVGDVGDANVPSRPVPTSPWVVSSSTHSAETAHQSQHNYDVHPNIINSNNTFQPDLTGEHATSIPSSSPFRLALRHRHQPHMMTTPQRGMVASSRGSYGTAHRRPGQLTSALLGIIDTIDGLATGEGRPPPPQQSQISRSAPVPPLHRSDGGLGGIGRASELNPDALPDGGNASSVYERGTMSEEESSLAMAREFLSRLLLFLACFVILCLLLF